MTFADRTTLLRIKRVKNVQLLTRETPHFIVPTPWPANSPDLSLIDYRIWGKLQERVCRSRIHDVAQLKRFTEEWEQFYQTIN